MDSESSKPTPPTSAKSKIATVPRIPQEIIDKILDHLSTCADSTLSLKSCALVSKPWVPSSRRHLFHNALFNPSDTVKWLKTFPVPEESPARHVRHLFFSIGKYDDVPEEFFEHIPWLTNVERVTLSGTRGLQQLQMPPFWRLPQSATSLTIIADTVTLAQVQDIMAQLPHLDDLSLCGSILAAGRRGSPGIGTVQRGRFGGRLRLIEGYATEDVMSMLLAIPTGLRFTEVQIRSTNECLLSTERLAEACRETLVRLSYTAAFYRKSDPFSRSNRFWCAKPCHLSWHLPL